MVTITVCAAVVFVDDLASFPILMVTLVLSSQYAFRLLKTLQATQNGNKHPNLKNKKSQMPDVNLAVTGSVDSPASEQHVADLV